MAKQSWLAVLSGLLLALSFPLSLPPLPLAVAAWLNFDLPTTPALGSLPVPLPNPLMPQTPELGYVQIPWLAYFALAPLLLALRQTRRPSQAVWLGFLAGAIWNTLNLFWFRDFGAIAVVCMSFYFALPLALFAFLAWWVAWGPDQLGTPVSIAHRSIWGTAALWTAVELLRSFGFWAFPWLLLGYSQAHLPPVIQCADIGGVYLVGFLIALGNAALAALLSSRLSARLRLSHALGAGGLLCLNLAYGYWRLDSIPRPDPPPAGAAQPTLAALPEWRRSPADGRRLDIALIQGGLSSREEWTLDRQDEAARAYTEPARQALRAWDADAAPAGSPGLLLIWPESCLINNNLDPSRLSHLPVAVRNLLAGRSGDGLLFGSIGRPHHERRFENGCMLMESPRQALWPYSKVRLVPYGEVVPFREVVRFLDFPWSNADITEGRRLDPVAWRGHQLAPLICFDNVFPFVPRQMARHGAEYLVLMTNNSWYTLRSGIRQHCDIDILRAVETRRPLARVSTTGWSHTLDAAGRIVIESNAGGAGVIQAALTPGPPLLLPGWAQGLISRLSGEAAAAVISRSAWPREPLYVNLGDLFAQLCLLWALALCLPPLLRGRSEGFL